MELFTNQKRLFDFSLLVYLAIALLVISDSGMQIFILTTYGPFSRTLRIIAFLLLSVKLLCTRYNKREFLLFFPFIVLSFYNYKISGNIECLYNTLIVISLKNVDLTKVFKIAFFSCISILLFLGILSSFGIGGELFITENFGRGSIETRYCFGLYHPNIWHQTFARSIVYFILGFHHKIKWPHMLALFLLNYAAYTFTLSRTGLLAVSLFIGLWFLYQYLPRLMHSFVVKFGIIMGLMGIYAFFLYTYYNFTVLCSPWAWAFDSKFTTGRIFQAVCFFREHSIGLWGNRVPDGTVFDFAFLRIFFENGYILGTLFIVLLLCTFFYAIKNNLNAVICVTLFVFLYALYEVPAFQRAPNNMLVFYIAFLLYPKLKKKT